MAKVARAVGSSYAGIIYLCSNQHGGTNKCAKYKPTRHSNPFPRLKPDNNPGSLVKMAGTYGLVEYWQGMDGLCGYDIKTTQPSITSQDDDPEWEYLAPRGTESERATSGDWIGYDSDAAWDWGLPATSDRVVLGQGFGLGVNMMLPNESCITYGDIFAPDSSDETRGIYVHLSREGYKGNEGKDMRIDVDWSTGKAIVQFTPAEVQTLGLIVGGYMQVHFYGMLRGRVVSLRNTAQTSTLRMLRVYSSDPYLLIFHGEVLRHQSSGVYYIYNLTAQVYATYYAGGTLATGSVVKVFREVPGTSYGQYNSLYTPVWQSGSLPSVTVASGDSKNALTTATYTSIGTIDGGMTGAVMIWYAANGNLLASHRVEVRQVTTIG